MARQRSQHSNKPCATERPHANGDGRAGNGSPAVAFIDLSEETRRRYLNYALSVITARALPDVRDGLKPVQRRILYVMYHDLHLHGDARPTKCMRICGDTTGNYHPHGDVAVYDALVRLAQDFVLRYPLVRGEGNFGSVDGDPPAAPRYTEARLAPLAEALMDELRYRTVDLRPNYLGTRDEPLVLPARFPHLLVNGVSGIAVGMATNIPPHNLDEVIRAAVHLIDHAEATTAQLMKFVRGPDFPLGGRITTDRRELRKIYETGSGSIRVQAEWRTERPKRGEADRIIITSVPYGVDTSALVAAIGEIIAARKVPQLLDVVNESTEQTGLRIVLSLKHDADAQTAMAYLYKHTTLEQNFNCNFTCLVPRPDGSTVPERLGLAGMLRHFLDFRFETVRRRFEFLLEQLRRRIHILEGFRIVFDDLDRALKIIRRSKGKADASENLRKAFSLDEEQASAVLDINLYRIAELEIRAVLEELKEKKSEAARIEKMLASKAKLWAVVKDDLLDVARGFADKRRTALGSSDDVLEFDPEAYIVRENTNVVLSRDGWIKRVGRITAIENTRVREGDEVAAVLPASTLDHVVLFASDGVAYTMRVTEVPATAGYGEPIQKFFRLADGARIVAAVSTDERFTPADHKVRGEDAPAPFVLVATALGNVLRVPLSPFRPASTRAGRRYCRLANNDHVVLAELVRDHRTMFLATAEGRVLHFAIKEVNVLAGPGKGVRGIKLATGDRVLGGRLLGRPSDSLAVETSNGSELHFGQTKYQCTSRGGKGVEAIRRGGFTRIIPPAIELVDWSAIEAAQA